MPIASGTWGSMPIAVIFGLLCYFSISALTISLTMIAISVLASSVCIVFGPEAIKATGKKDPSEVVADEAAGQAVTFLAIPFLSGNKIIITTAIGFLLFRIFDIIKPWPCRRLEKLPAGWGILADDLAAGVYAAVILNICVRFWLTA